MRLLTVSHFFEAHGGGIERVAGHLCRAFARQGIEAAWAASDQDPLPSGDVVALPLRCLDPAEQIIGLPMPIPGWRSTRMLAREIAASDGVIIHDALYVSSILAMLIARWKGKRTVLIQHIAAIPFSSRLLRWAMTLANRVVTRPMLRTADSLVFISDTVRQDLIGTPGWRDYQLLFNGVDTAIFHPAQDRRSPAITRRLLFVGRYVEKKGLAVLRQLAEARPDLQIVMAGQGPIRPSEWNLVNVRDLGPQSPEELARLYREADLLLLPSVGEGYPLVIQEAMACGLPTICGKPSERADPAATAWLRGVEIDLSDPVASAERCARAIDGFAASAAAREAMAAFAARRYSWETMAAGVLACFHPE